jgi:imidazole glycerol-phosphate synthase subunit HisH
MISVIDYGAGNLRSITNGLKKIGAESLVTSDPAALADADGIVLPGVGAFGDAMASLEDFKEAISGAVASGVPFLGLCLGEQVIFEKSEESPGIEGLGLFRGCCKRFRVKMKVPHMGWNTITATKDTPLLEGIRDGEYFYFVHSYYVVPNKRGIVAATTDYGITFPSVISLDNVHATQFHPEKSGQKGLQILRNFAGICRK